MTGLGNPFKAAERGVRPCGLVARRDNIAVQERGPAGTASGRSPGKEEGKVPKLLPSQRCGCAGERLLEERNQRGELRGAWVFPRALRGDGDGSKPYRFPQALRLFLVACNGHGVWIP